MLHSNQAQYRQEDPISGLLVGLLSEALVMLESDRPVSAKDNIRHVVRLVSADRGDEGEKAGKGGLSLWQQKRLDQFIEGALEDELPLAAAGQVAGLSASHFARAFRVSFGAPFHRYVTRRRVERACRLMLTTDIALSEVALGCGFADQAHFCRQFRAAMDETPNSWRRRMRLSE